MSFLLSLYMALACFVFLLFAITYRRKPRKPTIESKSVTGEIMRWTQKHIEAQQENGKTENINYFQDAILSIDEMDAAVKFTQELINKDL
jgi:hypothetical protein